MSENLQRYFTELQQLIELYSQAIQFDDLSAEELAVQNHRLFTAFLPENYAESFANPKYAELQLGELGLPLSFVFSLTLTLKDLIYHQDDFAKELMVWLNSIRTLWQKGELTPAKLDEHIKEFSFRLQDARLRRMIFKNYCSSHQSWMNEIMNADLFGTDHLYKLNIYVTPVEIEFVQHLAQLPQARIDQIAFDFMEAYLRAFPRNNMTRAGREGMAIEAIAGMERVTKALILEIKKRGFKPYIKAVECKGFNSQFEYDHKDDAALWLSEMHARRYQLSLKNFFLEFGEECRDYSGSFVNTCFGEEKFSPRISPTRYTFTDEQVKLNQQMMRAFFAEREKYILEEHRNFSIIGFPTPEIHSNFPEVFDAFLLINALDDSKFEEYQHVIIKALDQGTHVHILGKGENQTDLRVQLQPLSDPETQSGFFNCGADANIPVGEVFTSPQLKGTRGLLHIRDAWLDGFAYQNLKLHFEDGYVADYSCTNFEDIEQNKTYIKENLLFPFKSLPMGEFAIGTNTLAYAVARKYGIVDKLNTLFIEKMGPHFALGDTCYSFMEDLEVYNPDGREVIAKDNEMSIKRKENIDEAYTDVHTDITIPFEDVEKLAVVKADGDEIMIIENGLFILPGTEELNSMYDL